MDPNIVAGKDSFWPDSHTDVVKEGIREQIQRHRQYSSYRKVSIQHALLAEKLKEKKKVIRTTEELILFVCQRRLYAIVDAEVPKTNKRKLLQDEGPETKRIKSSVDCYTAEEDAKVLDAIDQCEENRIPRTFSTIHTMLMNDTQWQYSSASIQSRYMNYLKPDLRFTDVTIQEQYEITKKFEKFGVKTSLYNVSGRSAQWIRKTLTNMLKSNVIASGSSLCGYLFEKFRQLLQENQLVQLNAWLEALTDNRAQQSLYRHLIQMEYTRLNRYYGITKTEMGYILTKDGPVTKLKRRLRQRKPQRYFSSYFCQVTIDY